MIDVGRARVYKKVNKFQYCIVMSKLGDSLHQISKFFHSKLSFQTVVQIGIQLVTCLEQVHNLGYTFNDLKPDNILIGNTSIIDELKHKRALKKDINEKNQFYKVRLVDFGLIQRYLNDDGTHIQERIKDSFRGSI